MTVILSEKFNCFKTFVATSAFSFFGIIRVISSSNLIFEAKKPNTIKNKNAVANESNLFFWTK